LPTHLRTKSILNPGATTTLVAALESPLTEVDKAGITNGTRAVYVFGGVNYQDAFGVARFSKFRLEFKRESLSNSSLAWAPEGNEAS
jgi:hypothetical protein